MRICEYGCGREAKHKFKNGKWCCEKYFNKCPSYRKNLSIKNKGRDNKGKNNPMFGRKHSDETKEKLRRQKLGKKASEETKSKLSKSRRGDKNGFFGKTHSDETKEKLRIHGLGRNLSVETRRKISDKNKGKKLSKESIAKLVASRKGIKISDETKNKIRIANKLDIKIINKRYPTFSKIEEMRYNPDKPEDKEIQVHCKNHKCSNSKEKNGWFTPIGHQFDGRRRAIEDPNGNGAAYFYCSNSCKEECPLYSKTVQQLIKEDQMRAGIIKEEYYTQEEYQIWRSEVLKRSNNQCEYCGQEAKHCHHIQPQKLQPYLSLDPGNGLACCQNCHYKYGHKDECSTRNLAQIICN